GRALRLQVCAHLSLGRQALRKRDAARAVRHFNEALTAPENLGEANHPLANQSDIHYWLGCALVHMGDQSGARRHWTAAAEFKGYSQTMSVRSYSEMTYYSALALQRLERRKEADRLLGGLLPYAQKPPPPPAMIDYFATSLPE